MGGIDFNIQNQIKKLTQKFAGGVSTNVGMGGSDWSYNNNNSIKIFSQTFFCFFYIASWSFL